MAATGAAATYALLASGVLPGAVVLALALAVVVLVPTARRYPLRIALNGALVLGWSPFLWWVRWPVPLDHGAVVVAAGVAVALLVVLSAADPRARARALLPRPRPVDVLLPLAPVAAAVAVRGWAFASGPREALAALLPGIDNVAHFQIFSTMRAHGAVLAALPPAPDGGRWGFTGYPAGFHSTAASVAELLEPGSRVGPSALALYTHSVAVVIALGLLVLVSAIASLPRLEDRPWICAAVVTLTGMAFLWSPGQNVFYDGFGVFWLGTVAAATATLLSVDPRRPWSPVRCLAVVGLLLAVSQTWAPLLLVAAPALLTFVVQARRPRLRAGARWRWAAALVLLVLAVAALAKVYAALTGLASIRFLLTATGGLTGTSAVPTFALLVTAVYACLTFRSWLVPRAARPPTAPWAPSTPSTPWTPGTPGTPAPSTTCWPAGCACSWWCRSSRR